MKGSKTEPIGGILENLRKLRVFKNISQQEIADKLECDCNTYVKIESGESILTLTRLFQLATILKVDWSFISMSTLLLPLFTSTANDGVLIRTKILLVDNQRGYFPPL